MIDNDREQLKRDCSDALHAIQQDQDVPGLEGFPARLQKLGPTYQYHAPLLQVAINKKDIAGEGPARVTDKATPERLAEFTKLLE